MLRIQKQWPSEDQEPAQVAAFTPEMTQTVRERILQERITICCRQLRIEINTVLGGGGTPQRLYSLLQRSPT